MIEDLIELARSKTRRHILTSLGEGLSGDSLRRVQDIWSSAACDAAYYAEKLLRAGGDEASVRLIVSPYVKDNET